MQADSVSQWIAQATEGDEAAAQQLFNRYYERLVGLARQKLKAIPSPVADDEGAAASAFRSFFSGIQAVQFQRLEGRDDLWRILATITVRKSIAQIRRHWKQKGEGNRVDRTAQIAEHLDRSLSPAEVVALVDECQQRLDALDDPALRQIALLRLEGYDTKEIADKLKVHQRTIQRKLSIVQQTWLLEPASD